MQRYKSGFVCEDERRKNVRKPLSKCVEDVFSAQVWLASAPLHEAGKTTRSGNTLKTGIGRGQLSFASDNPSSNPNACPLISTFSKPHSEVASNHPHLRAEVLSKRCSAVFYVHPTGSPHSQMQDFERGVNRIFIGETESFPGGKLLMSSCRKKVTTRQRSSHFALPSKSCICRGTSGLSKTRFTV